MTDILIDVTRLLGRLLKGRRATGVDRVDLAYVRHFASRARAVVRVAGRSAILSRAASARVFGQLAAQSEGLHPGVLWQVLGGAAGGSAEAVPAGAVYLNIGHSGLEQPQAMARLRRRGVQPVFMVHDLIPITHHEFCRPGEHQRHLRRMRTVLDTAAAVLVTSQTVQDQLAAFAAREGRRLPPVHKVPLAPGLRVRPPGERPLAAPYFVVLGTIEPRKNLALLLLVWRRLVERHGEGAPWLVLAGRRGWECENVVDLIERSEPLRSRLIELTACTDAELAAWLHHAQALLFPSLVEGYGLPLVEALQIGTPVIASDLPAFREIAGAIPQYLDPLDGPGWMAQIIEYASADSAARKAQCARMAGFTVPTWQQHFAAVDGIVAQLQAGKAVRAQPATEPA